MKQCLLLYKAHRHPPRPPPRRKACVASSPLSVGEEPQGGLSNPESRLPRELTLLALLSSRQHTDCVYPQQRKFIWREEHTACNAICSRPSASFVALKAVVELILSACGRQTTPNKTHNRERQTHTE